MKSIMAACGIEGRQRCGKIRVYLKLVTTFACLIGCFYHSFLVTRQYLKYETLGIFGSYIPRSEPVPNLALCFTQGLQRTTHRTFLNQNSNQTTHIIDFHDSQVEASQLIENCRFRNFTTGSAQNGKCDQVFTITRRLAGFYECFMLFLRKKSSYNLLKMVTSTTARSYLYQMSLTSNRSRVERILPMINFKTWPYDEFLFSFDLDVLGKGELYFYLDYMTFIFKKLPLPYDTDCVEYRPSNCIVSAKRSYKGVCGKSICVNNITITLSKMAGSSKAGIHFEVDSITSPVNRIKYVAKIRPGDFFILICSVLGLWLGLSFIFFTEQFIDALEYLFKSEAKGSNSSAMKFSKIQAQIIVTATRARIHFKSLNLLVINQLANRMTLNRKFHFVFLSNLVSKVVIAGLCCFELYSITFDYFLYKTLMEIDVQRRAVIPYPEVSYCIDLEEVIHVKIPEYFFEVYDSQMDRFTHEFNFTLSQFFSKVPNPDSVIKSCRVRRSMSSPLEMYTNCSKYFQVDKFWQSAFMCYKFKPTLDHLIAANKLRRNIHQPGVLFSLALKEDVAEKDFKHYQLIVSYGFPSMSRFLSNRLYKKNSKLLKVVSFFTYKYTELPAPYDTDCIYMGSFSGCNIKCMNLSLINRIPYSELYEKPVDKYLVNYLDMKNSTVATILRDQEKKCERICRRDCNDDFTKTVQSYEYSSKEPFEIALLIPSQPSFLLQAVPHYTFSLFIYQIACCLSFWAGFCLIKLNNFWSSATPVSTAQPQMVHLNALVDRLEKIVFSRVGKGQRGYLWMKLKFKFKSRIFSNIFFIICSVCFSYHCYDSTSFYFRYLTLLDTRLRFESNFTALYSTMCITIDQLDLQGNYSLANIFNKSPDTSNLMLECGHRGLNLEQWSHLTPLLKQRIMPWVNSTRVCEKYFDITKTITFGMVCYLFAPKPGAQDAEFNPKYHILGPKTFEYFTINYNLARYNLTITTSQDMPSLSLYFATQTPATEKSKAYWYWVSYSKFYVDSLPYPYYMGKYIGIKHQRCVRRCVEAYWRERGKFSSFGRVYSPLNLTHETNEEFMSKESQKVTKNCEAKCDVNRFFGRQRISYTSTFTDGPFADNSATRGSIGYWYRTSDYLVTYTEFKPWQRLLDLFLAIGTSFSIWFGLSCLDLADLVLKIPHHSSNDKSTELLDHRLKQIDQLVRRRSVRGLMH